MLDSSAADTPDTTSSTQIRSEKVFEFYGKSGEYFKIWIVNALLTVVTLGIYSAWAKVRTKRYFYANTCLDGSSFDYTADPVQILKGRILAVIIYVAYELIAYFAPQFSTVAFFALVIIVPFVIVKSMQFRLHNSVWRGVRFGFNANYKKAYLLFFPPILYFGVLAFLPFILGVDFAELEKIGNQTDDSTSLPENFDQTWQGLIYYFIALGGAVVLASLLFPWWQKKYYEYIGNFSRYGSSQFSFIGYASEFYGIYVGSALVFVGAFLVLAAVFSGLYMVLNFLGLAPMMVKFGLFTAAAFLMFIPYSMLMAYVITQRTNVVYSNLELDDVTFSSQLSPKYMMFLYASNTVAILCSLGFAIPWAMIRTARYRAACMFVRTADLNSFVAKQGENLNAVGEEMGEVFGLDIGL